MELEDCLVLVHNDAYIFGTELNSLLELKNGSTINSNLLPLPHPFCFGVQIPDLTDYYIGTFTQGFMYDSKLYVAKGGFNDMFELKLYDSKHPCLHLLGSDHELHLDLPELFSDEIMPYCRIFELDPQKFHFNFPGFHQIPQLPTPFAPTFIGNIGEDVYCLVHQHTCPIMWKGFWILQGNCWKRLLSPPHPPRGVFRNSSITCFVIDTKLYVEFFTGEKYYLFVYDSVKGVWEDAHKAQVSFVLKPRLHCCYCTKFFVDTSFYPSAMMHLPKVSGCTITLTSTWCKHYRRLTVFATLFDNKDSIVSCYQPLDPFEGIGELLHEDIMFCWVADLGQGRAWAHIYGRSLNNRLPVICISIFSISVIEHALPARAMQHNFLDMQVHCKHIFSLNGFDRSEFFFCEPSIFLLPRKGRGKGKRIESKGGVVKLPNIAQLSLLEPKRPSTSIKVDNSMRKRSEDLMGSLEELLLYVNLYEE